MIEVTEAIRCLKAPFLAAGAAFALAGCAATHVGEDWQCPLTQGSQCTSVTAADPAVKQAAGTDRPTRSAPLVPIPGAAERRGGSGPGTDERGRTGRRGCDARCHLFAWIASLFGDGEARDDANTGGVRKTALSGMTEDSAAGHLETAIAEGTSSVTTAAASVGTDDGAPGDDLRAPETIGRIWIAPWVDGEGVYREASWVRTVIAPAAWKRP